MPKRSLSMPYRGAHPDGERGCAMVAPAESFSQSAEISAAESPRTETKNGFLPCSHGIRGHVVSHHAEAVPGGDLAPHHLIGLRRSLDVLRVLVGDDGDVTAEHRLVELQRRSGIATEIEVVGNAYCHDSLLCRFRASSVLDAWRVGATGIRRPVRRCDPIGDLSSLMARPRADSGAPAR